MRIAGKRLKRTRLIRTEKYVVAVDVELVVPVDDPGEACYESDTIEFLKEVKHRAEQSDIDWLMEKGKVYAAVNVA
jgi:hypothetical protein